MNTAATLLLENLGRTTLALALAGIVATVVLRLARSQWPTAHRAAWVLVLLVGWMFLRLPVAVPWYEMQSVAPPLVDLAPPPALAAEPQVIELAPQIPPLDVPVEAATSIPQLPAAVSFPATINPAIVPAVSQTRPVAPWYQAVRWPTVVVAAWILGMSLCAAAWLVGYLRFVHLLRDRRPADDASAAAWRELLAAAGIRQSIPLTVSQQFGPMLCCLPRGYELIVPAELWSELDGAGQRAILRHELAHYQRGDVWKSLAARVLALPHWFNPIAWLAVRRFEEAAEWACDRAAIADQPATEYAKLLVHLGQTPHALGYGSSAHGRTLAARVRRVLKGDEQQDSTMKKMSLLLVGLLIVGVSAVQLNLVAQQTGEKTTSEDDDNAKAVESDAIDKQPSDVVPGKSPEEVSKSDPNTPQQRMIDEAKRAFQAHQAAYDAQTVTLPTVYDWSLRWMQALESVARNRADRIAAARDHVERMGGLQKRIELLYNIGSHGGEAKYYAAANFYLAEAEKHLAEVEAQGIQPKTVTLNLLRSTSGDAARQMAEQCKQVYEFNKSQSIQNVPLETQVTWSLRWLRAAELAAGNQAERIAAARDHVQRLSELKDATEQLFKIGSKGGSTADLAAATFHLAEAEKHLAEAEAGSSSIKSEPTTQPTSRELETVDLEIKLTELRGELEQTAVKIKTAESKLTSYRRVLAQQPAALSSGELATAQGELERLKVQRATLEEQIKLHEKKLAMFKRQPQAAEPRLATIEGLPQESPEGPPTLLYAGKDFDAWAEILRTDLSDERKVEAIKALAAFGSHGHGRVAAKEIIEAAERESLYVPGVANNGFLQTQIFEAFGSKIPHEEAIPLLRAELDSKSVGQRIFATQMLMVAEDPDEVVKLLTPLIEDSHAAVRRTVAVYLVSKSPGTPGLIDVLRECLSPNAEPWQSQMAVQAIGQAPKSMQIELAPEVVRLLDRDFEGMGGAGSEVYLTDAARLLRQLGPAAIPALEEGAKSDDEVVRLKSLSLLKSLRDQPPPAEPPAK